MKKQQSKLYIAEYSYDYVESATSMFVDFYIMYIYIYIYSF